MNPPRLSRPAPILLLILFALSFHAAPAAGGEGYHTLAEVDAALDAHAAAHPDRVTLLEIGTSAGGHPIRVARVTSAADRSPEKRPGVFVGANLVGFHNAGTEAALHLLDTVLGSGEDAGSVELLASRTFYIAPALHPDAHDALFGAVRQRVHGNAQPLDHDRDGFVAEDGSDDLDGDGRITGLRIPDPTGKWLPHPDEPRLMVEQDAKKGWIGAYRLDSEGRDDDGDGASNEDPAHGIVPNHNFPQAFPFPEPAAGPWPSYAPETKALLDFFFAHRHIALAVIYGPANNFLALPEKLGDGVDPGSMTFSVPPQFAEAMGLDPDEEYTLDEVWEAAKNLSFVRRNNITKQQLGQFLGAGPANEIESADRAILERFAKDYKKRLEDADIDTKRPAAQYAEGGLTPWLYFQFGALAVELDVWGVPTPKKEASEDDEGAAAELTVDGLAEMSSEDFLAFGEEKIAAFLEEAGVPPQFSAAMVISRVEGGQLTPAQMSQMVARMGGGGGGSGGDGDDAKDDKATERRRQVLAWLDANHPDAMSPWTEVTLADGMKAEAGGLDPFAEVAPPREHLDSTLDAHTVTVLEIAAELPQVKLLEVTAKALGKGVYQVTATAANRGALPTHTQMAVRARALLPVLLDLELGESAALVTGQTLVKADRLEARTGVVRGEWLVRADSGTSIAVSLRTESAGSDHQELVLE